LITLLMFYSTASPIKNAYNNGGLPKTGHTSVDRKAPYLCLMEYEGGLK
jgi:hypothetical protein